MGKVYLNSENKLVVETDNGVINPDGTTTVKLTDKKYTINGDDLSTLLNIVNGANVERRRIQGIFSNGYISIDILSNEEMGDEIKRIEGLYNKVWEENKKLRLAIRNYNQNKKIFWKPIKIED